MRDDGRQFERLAVEWPSANRIAWQKEEAVAPGEVGTFTFQVRAPDALGAYEIPLRLVVDGVTWLDDERVVARVEVVSWQSAPDLLVQDAVEFLTARLQLLLLATALLAAALASWLAVRMVRHRLART